MCLKVCQFCDTLLLFDIENLKQKQNIFLNKKLLFVMLQVGPRLGFCFNDTAIKKHYRNEHRDPR